jgi:uncharacterized protein
MAAIQLTLPYNHTEEDLRQAIAQRIGEEAPYRILKRSVDARAHRNIVVLYSITTECEDPVESIHEQIRRQKDLLARSGAARQVTPVVVGTGPGGLFCAYWLALHGIKPMVLEQGPPMRERLRDMARFMKKGSLDPYSNVCFGAGGAGTYSDGKLMTRIRSPYIPFVMETFVQHGAPEPIRYLYNPHLGSNIIRRCIERLLETLTRQGADVKFRTRFMEFTETGDGRISALLTNAGPLPEISAVFAATGHSSRETYALFRSHAVAMESKEFAVGVRVEHPARRINDMQYGLGYETRYPAIETAQYKFAQTWKEEARAVYSFCMCPGGYVINASTDVNGVVTNGMSNATKSGRFSNAAIVVNVSLADLRAMGHEGVDAGLEFQKELEERFRASVNVPGSAHIIPAQLLPDFVQGERSRLLGQSSCSTPIAASPMHDLFPAFIHDALRKGFGVFDGKMKGFGSDSGAQVFGVESRTSAPYRILRGQDTLASPTHPNLYPIGEGAGYAGGITSAAVDGIRCAQAYIESLFV